MSRCRGSALAAAALAAAAVAAAAAQVPADDAPETPAPAVPALPEPGEILALDDEMRRFVAASVKSGGGPKDRLDELLDAMLKPKKLGLDAEDRSTRTAAQTFAHRGGNCISFTNLFVALAREAGFAVYFTEVDEVLNQDQHGENVLNNKHMFATVEVENVTYPVDFGREGGKYRLARRISDQRAVAHFYNNLGVERLLVADPGAALPFFDRAVELDPTLAEAWINKGVAHRRCGEPERAELAYLRAIQLDGSETSAFANLALLYELQGRDQEAQAFRDRVESYRDKSPYHHFTLGVQAMQQKDYVEAVRRFRHALRRAPHDGELYFALGDAYYRQGNLERSRESLKRAVRYAKNQDRRGHYERALQALDRLPGGATAGPSDPVSSGGRP